jgi:hypothetical protein
MCFVNACGVLFRHLSGRDREMTLRNCGRAVTLILLYGVQLSLRGKCKVEPNRRNSTGIYRMFENR